MLPAYHRHRRTLQPQMPDEPYAQKILGRDDGVRERVSGTVAFADGLASSVIYGSKVKSGQKIIQNRVEDIRIINVCAMACIRDTGIF